VRCADAAAEFKSNRPPLALKSQGHADLGSCLAADRPDHRIYQPPDDRRTGSAGDDQANWAPRPNQGARPVDLAGKRFDRGRATGGRPCRRENLLKAERLDLNGRLVSGTVQANPVIEMVLKLAGASAPAWHPAAATPVDADITAELRGLKDFSPKPWTARFRELQAADGRIDITNARVQQRDTIAVATGSLGLSPAGRLNGELRLTVANLEAFLPTLGLDQMLSQEKAPSQLNNALGALDRLMPGLGNVARKNAAPMIAASVNLMGRQPSSRASAR